MEEQDVPIDDVHEEIHHHAEHSRERWISAVALSTALIAALAAICSLLSGDNANEAMMEQINASDQWAYYQAKGIKSAQLATKIEVLEAMGKPAKDADREKVAQYEKQQREIRDQAEELKKTSKVRLGKHKQFAAGVTLFQIAIAVSAISVLTRQRWFWFAGLVFAAAGVAYLAYGLAPHPVPGTGQEKTTPSGSSALLGSASSLMHGPTSSPDTSAGF